MGADVSLEVDLGTMREAVRIFVSDINVYYKHYMHSDGPYNNLWTAL